MHGVVYNWTRWSLRGLRGIEPWEVMQVLTGQRRWPRRGRNATGASILTIWGRTTAGRALIVGVYQQTEDPWDWQIAGAREMTTDELAQFAQWEETR
ncbi:MAG: hypothetical protein J2P18_12455 [Nocardia sp.]|nr:hypothetical protein [Nocardia sp.]